MAKNAKVNVLFGADLTQFSTAMQNAQRKINRMGKNLQKVGKSLTIGVTAPLLAIGVAGVRAWDKQEKAIAQVNAGLIATGNAVGYTSEQLQTMASELQNNTLFGDEEILKDATAQLLTFTNIAQNQFARTQQAALDLATRLGGDLKSASIQLGKALNDPVANLSALSRSGIQFSTEQKKVINALAKTNRLADAQTIILDELEKQYGGSAEAAAKAGLGPFQQLGNIIGDLNEDFGAIIADAILPFVDKIKGLATSFKELSPETKKFIVILAGVTAAVGPLLALAGTILPAIVSGFSLLASPIGLVVAALVGVGVVIYKYWDPIKKTLVDIANYFVDLYNESTVFRFAVDAITLTFKNMWTGAKFVFNALVSILKFTADAFVNSFKTIGKIIKGALTLDYDLIKKGWEDYQKAGIGATSELINNLKSDWNTFTVGVGENIKTSIENAGKRAKIVLTDDNIVDKTTNPIVGKPSKASGTALAGTTTGVSSFDTTGFEQTFDNFGFTEEQIAQQEAYAQRLVTSQQLLSETSQIVGDEVANAFAGMANSFVDSLGLADDGFQGFVKSLGKSIIQMIARLLSQAIATAITTAVTGAAGLGAAGVYAAPAMIAGSVATVGSAFAAVPSFADGGLIYGPTSAIVGEYPGASSNPEVIAPLNKLRKLIQPAQSGVTDVNVHGVFEIDGRKLRLVLDRTDQQFNRLT